MTLKLGDFGAAKELAEGMRAVTTAGTPLYMAPEALVGNPYDTKADLWSVGIILFQLLTKKILTEDADIERMFRVEQRSLTESELEAKLRAGRKGNEDLSPECVNVISILLQFSPADRCSLEELCAHPWFPEGSFSPVSDVANPAALDGAKTGWMEKTGERNAAFKKRWFRLSTSAQQDVGGRPIYELCATILLVRAPL